MLSLSGRALPIASWVFLPIITMPTLEVRDLKYLLSSLDVHSVLSSSDNEIFPFNVLAKTAMTFTLSTSQLTMSNDLHFIFF